MVSGDVSSKCLLPHAVVSAWVSLTVRVVARPLSVDRRIGKALQQQFFGEHFSNGAEWDNDKLHGGSVLVVLEKHLTLECL